MPRNAAAVVDDYSTIQVPGDARTNLLHDPRAGHHLLHPPPLQRKGEDTVGGKAQPPHHWRWIYCRRRRDTTRIAVRDHSAVFG